MDKLFQYHDDSTIKYDFTPTFILPPQGGGNKRIVNPSINREEIRKDSNSPYGGEK